MAETSSPTASFSADRPSQDDGAVIPPLSGMSVANDSAPNQAALDVPKERIEKILHSEVCQ
jgi:hypothetical protein